MLGARPNQLERRRDDVVPDEAALLSIPDTPGEITEQGLRTNVSVGIRYLDAWLHGVGAAAIDNLMEDAATAEISRSQVWQWVRAGRFTEEHVRAEAAFVDAGNEARELFLGLALAPELVELSRFLRTLVCHERRLDGAHQERRRRLCRRRERGVSVGSTELIEERRRRLCRRRERDVSVGSTELTRERRRRLCRRRERGVSVGSRAHRGAEAPTLSLDSTKADDIALVIEEAIVSGELEPGTVLRQEQLSEQFNVSRTPVREALRRLAALGLVSFVPNRGVRVRTISRDDLHEAFMVRAELEGLATEVAAAKMSPEDHAELEAAERRFAEISRQLRALDPGEERRAIMGDWVRANHGFHDVIYRVADLPLVEQLAKSARRSFSGPAVWAPGDHSIDGLYVRNAEQHRAIRQALVAGSAAGARALAREHVLSSFVLLETILEQVGAQPRDWQRGRAARR